MQFDFNAIGFNDLALTRETLLEQIKKEQLVWDVLVIGGGAKTIMRCVVDIRIFYFFIRVF